MPWTLKTKDGIELNGIPDTVDPNSQELKDRVAKIREQRQNGTLVESKPKDSYGEGWIGALGRGLAGGLASILTPSGNDNPYRGIEAGAQWRQESGGDMSKPFQQSYLDPTLTDAVAKELDKLGVPQPQDAAQRIFQGAMQGVASSVGTLGIGKLLSMARPAEAGMDIGSIITAQPVQQIAAGAGAGASAQGASELGADSATQTAAGITGALIGGGLAGKMQTGVNAMRGSPGVAETSAEQLVKDAGGRTLMTSDVFPPKGSFSVLAQNLAEKNPFFGTAGMRAGQQAERIGAIEDTLRDFGAGNLSDLSASVQRDLASTRNGIRGDAIAAKNQVISDLSQSGTVPVKNALDTIDSSIRELQALKTDASKGVIKQLQDWRRSLEGQTLDNVETIRKDVIGAAYKDPADPTASLGKRFSNPVYGALRKDIEQYVSANAGPDALKTWKESNATLKQSIDELKTTGLKLALDKGDSSVSAVQNLLFSSDKPVSQTLFRNLSEQGRANARAAILSKAADNAVTSGTDTISPEKFVTQVQKLGGPVGVFFSDADKAQINGLVRYLNATRQASKAGLNPPTGQQLLIPATGLGAVGFGSGMLGGGLEGGLQSLALTAAGGTAVGVMSRIYESPVVRNSLIALSKAAPGSKDQAMLIKRITQGMQAMQDQQIGEQ